MPWYKSGTVSVVQNSNAVIGTGTAFISNGRVGDGFRGPDGGWYEVTNIASDTAMSISPNYQGVTNAAGVYALAPLQGYVKDSADALRAFVNLYGPKLAALGTTGNYDILPVNKGGTGGTDQAGARAGLGLGSAATLTAGSAAGNVMLVGDRNSPTVTTINTWGNSFQLWNSTATVGAPEAGSFGTILNTAWPGGGYGAQILMSVTGRIWFRAGDYTSALMREIYHTGNTTRAADGTLKAI
jgi:hypothetical protein